MVAKSNPEIPTHTPMTAKGTPTAKTFCSDAAAITSTQTAWPHECAQIAFCTEKFMLGLVRRGHVVLVACQGHESEKWEVVLLSGSLYHD